MDKIFLLMVALVVSNCSAASEDEHDLFCEAVGKNRSTCHVYSAIVAGFSKFKGPFSQVMYTTGMYADADVSIGTEVDGNIRVENIGNKDHVRATLFAYLTQAKKEMFDSGDCFTSIRHFGSSKYETCAVRCTTRIPMTIMTAFLEGPTPCADQGYCYVEREEENRSSADENRCPREGKKTDEGPEEEEHGSSEDPEAES